MAKAFVQDVVPPRRSVRQIVVASGGTEKSPSMQHAPLEEGGGGVRSRGRSFSPPSFGRRRSSKGIWLIALSALVFLYLTFAIFFAGAKVTITPRQEATVINGSFVAKQNPVLSELPFETMTVFLEKTATVPATGEKYLEQKASGIITIYNDYNNAPLRLIKNTRFESPGGLIYRIANSVVVPPQEIVDGVKKPGMIDAEIYADTAGAEYDLASGLFTIPGLKDSPQFSGFYAKTKTPIVGGYDGMTKVLDPAQETQARAALKTALVQEASIRAQQELPPGFVLFDTMAYTEYVPLANTPTQDANTVLIGEKITFRGVIFNTSALARYIAQNTVANFNNNEQVYIPNLKNVQFTLVDKETTKPWEAEMIRLVIAGNVSIIWTIDEEQLKKDLVAKPKKEMNTILGAYPGIAKAAVTIRPFWKKTFPRNPSRITILNTIGKKESEETKEETAPVTEQATIPVQAPNEP